MTDPRLIECAKVMSDEAALGDPMIVIDPVAAERMASACIVRWLKFAGSDEMQQAGADCYANGNPNDAISPLSAEDIYRAMCKYAQHELKNSA